jgi:hypothetical protein
MNRLPFPWEIDCLGKSRALYSSPGIARPMKRGASRKECCRGRSNFSDDLMRRVDPQTRHLRQSLHRSLMLVQQIRVVQLIHLLFDSLQLFQWHLHEPTIDRVDFLRDAQSASHNCCCVARKRRSASAATVAGLVSPSASAFNIPVHWRPADPRPDWTLARTSTGTSGPLQCARGPFGIGYKTQD